MITLSSKYFYIYKRKYSFRRISNREYCVCGRFMFIPIHVYTNVIKMHKLSRKIKMINKNNIGYFCIQ